MIAHMWTAPVGKRFFGVVAAWSAAVICPAFWRGALAAGADEFRRPWSRSLRRAFSLMTIHGLSSASVATMSFITSRCARQTPKKVKTFPIAFRSTPWRTSPGGSVRRSGDDRPYVDGPGWQAVFGVVSGLVGCGHMSGLLARRIGRWP